MVGLASSAVYALVMMLATSVGGIEAKLGSVIAYLSAMVINFPLQRGFTFASQGNVRVEALKYLGVHSLNLLVAVGTVHLIVSVLEWPVIISVVATIVVIPLMQFLALEVWVFSPREHN
jgi:putative flippase GtrA